MSNTAALPGTLQQIRKARRLSQLELSFRLGVSQRHVSFVESGRARPSRSLLLTWLHELDTPLSVRNAALLQAGFAPAYSEAPLADPALAEANHALEQLLAAHDPLPALVIDAHWNLLRLNRGARWVAAVLMPWAAPVLGTAPLNLLDVLAHPNGPLAAVTNLDVVGPAIVGHLRHEAIALPELTPRVEAVAAQIRGRLGEGTPAPGWPPPAAPVLTTRYATPHGELAFFSMFTTFGTPQDITLASLRVEHWFAADQATRAVVEAEVR